MAMVVVVPKLFHPRVLLAGVVVALTLGAPARAEMGNASEATLGKVLKAEKSTVELVCGLGAACRIDDVFHAAFHALQVVREGALEQNFQADSLGFGSIFSLLTSDEFVIDQVCWSGSGVRECVEVSVDDDVTPSSCPTVIQVVSEDQDACDAAAALFSPAPNPDYVVVIDEDNYAGPIEVITCAGVFARCLESADITQNGAVGLAHDSVGGYDGKRLGGSKYF